MIPLRQQAVVAVRDASRFARSVPAVRSVLERSDPARRVRRILKAGIIDADLYARQLGVTALTEKEAAEHYVRQGHLEGMTLNALIDNYLLRRSRSIRRGARSSMSTLRAGTGRSRSVRFWTP